MRGVERDWVATADHAERRWRGQAPSLFRQAADRTTLTTQLAQLIDAIAVSRKQLRELAAAVTGMPPEVCASWWIP
jgi:hypothetical protein